MKPNTPRTIRPYFTALCSFAAGALTLLEHSAEAASSTFAIGDEGWTLVSFTNLSTDDYSVIGTYSPIYLATGGNPDGYISSNDPDGGDFTFAAPAIFRGNQSGAFGTTLSYDLLHTGTLNYQVSDVILEGGGLRLLWESTPPLAPTNVWQHVTVGLSPSPQWHVATRSGSTPTTTEFQNALGNVTGLFIRGEYTDGPETAGFDNPTLVPEPAISSLIATSFGVSLAMRPRRKHKGTNG